MLRLTLSGMARHAVVALALLAWLLGANWHGAMQIQAAFGDEICTAEGSKRLPGGVPSDPASYKTESCSLCAAAGSPSIGVGDAAATHLSLPDAGPHKIAGGGKFVPASHLADLASRAPPRA